MSSRVKLHRGDAVKIITGANKGKTGKIVAVLPSQNAVKVEGIQIVKRHSKPNMAQPQGGIIDKHIPIDVSKVALVIDTKTDSISKISHFTKKDGSKVRMARKTNKEIDV